MRHLKKISAIEVLLKTYLNNKLAEPCVPRSILFQGSNVDVPDFIMAMLGDGAKHINCNPQDSAVVKQNYASHLSRFNLITQKYSTKLKTSIAEIIFPHCMRGDNNDHTDKQALYLREKISICVVDTVKLQVENVHEMSVAAKMVEAIIEIWVSFNLGMLKILHAAEKEVYTNKLKSIGDEIKSLTASRAGGHKSKVRSCKTEVASLNNILSKCKDSILMQELTNVNKFYKICSNARELNLKLDNLYRMLIDKFAVGFDQVSLDRYIKSDIDCIVNLIINKIIKQYDDGLNSVVTSNKITQVAHDQKMCLEDRGLKLFDYNYLYYEKLLGDEFFVRLGSVSMDDQLKLCDVIVARVLHEFNQYVEGKNIIYDAISLDNFKKLIKKNKSFILIPVVYMSAFKRSEVYDSVDAQLMRESVTLKYISKFDIFLMQHCFLFLVLTGQMILMPLMCSNNEPLARSLSIFNSSNMVCTIMANIIYKLRGLRLKNYLVLLVSLWVTSREDYLKNDFNADGHAAFIIIFLLELILGCVLDSKFNEVNKFRDEVEQKIKSHDDTKRVFTRYKEVDLSRLWANFERVGNAIKGEDMTYKFDQELRNNSLYKL